jgi:hypothetical protein
MIFPKYFIYQNLKFIQMSTIRTIKEIEFFNHKNDLFN